MNCLSALGPGRRSPAAINAGVKRACGPASCRSCFHLSLCFSPRLEPFKWDCSPKPRHGLLSELSRRHQVWRQTLYRWKERGAKALEAALESKPKPCKGTLQIKEYVLTLLIEAHASYRNIQKCVRRMCGVHLSLGSIAAIVQEAGQRAQRWLNEQRASTPRACPDKHQRAEKIASDPATITRCSGNDSPGPTSWRSSIAR